MVEKLLNEKEVAQLLGCSLSKLRTDRWLCRGLPFTKIGKGVRYLAEDVDRYINDHRVETRQ